MVRIFGKMGIVSRFYASEYHCQDEEALFELSVIPVGCTHSKYNPVERVWSGLENHWNSSLLDTAETVLNFARTMTWMGCHPVVKLVEKTYLTGVGLTPKQMKELEKRFERLKDLEKWFVRIEPVPP